MHAPPCLGRSTPYSECMNYQAHQSSSLMLDPRVGSGSELRKACKTQPPCPCPSQSLSPARLSCLSNPCLTHLFSAHAPPTRSTTSKQIPGSPSVTAMHSSSAFSRKGEPQSLLPLGLVLPLPPALFPPLLPGLPPPLPPVPSPHTPPAFSPLFTDLYSLQPPAQSLAGA